MSGPIATVIGWPIKHSRSPVIHRFWLAEHGIEGDYITVAVLPGEVPYHFRKVRRGIFVGSNVTIPHKEDAFDSVNLAMPAAEATEAVNTVWMEGDRLIGTNTDPEGFLANLDAGAPGWSEKAGTAVVVGAGGAARGVAYALSTRGLDRVTVVNRTESRAVDLAERLGGPVVARPWSALGEVLADARLLVNATSLGMAGQPPLEIDISPLPDDALVTDIVYTPLVTPLLAAARARGLATVDGLGMLLHQAAPGFHRWFGVRPKVSEALRAAVLATMD